MAIINNINIEMIDIIAQKRSVHILLECGTGNY
jgi:hypothetical protein